jgi:hypothetical protein
MIFPKTGFHFSGIMLLGAANAFTKIENAPYARLRE